MEIHLKKLLLLPLLVFAFSCFAHDPIQRRVISVNGQGSVEVKPDMAVINLSVRATHKSGKIAKQDVDDRVNNFLDVLPQLGIKQEDVIASNLRINPRYEHSSAQRLFKGYEATRNVTVTLHKLERLTEVMDKALELRLEGIDQIRYDSSEADKHRDAAHQLAIKNSRTKANKLAEAYDAELGAILTINYHNNPPIYGGIKMAAMEDQLSMQSRQSRPGTYLADKIVFNDQIQVSFDLIVSE